MEQATISSAAAEFIARQDRRVHPAGKFDKAGRWFPAAGEECDCCATVRSPSRAWPYSRMLHCRTAAHVAAVHGVSAVDLRRAAKALRAAAEQVAA